jgi:glycolate oxidase iron-sulfur subunit
MRQILSFVLPYPTRFRFALAGAYFAKPLRPLLAQLPVVGARLEAMLALAPSTIPPRSVVSEGQHFPAAGPRRKRVAILTGCAQPVLKPSINDATIRLLNRLGVEVILPKGEGCCGALVHHMGREQEGHAFAKANIDSWMKEIEGQGLDAIIITASGCGTTIKDYGHMLRGDADYAEKAVHVSALAKDITEFLVDCALSTAQGMNLTVAYHSACSMQHGQKITDAPKNLLKAVGFKVKDVPESHICCGSAGVYNILQPEIAGQLRSRKVKNIERTKPDIIATGNIGCMTQIGKGTLIPIVHTVELLDWATGGPMPDGIPGSLIK